MDEAVVVADSSNLLVHLAPAPVVARVATGTGIYRPGDGWLAREVAVTTHLAAAGAPAVRPSGELPPGPHTRDGFVVSFWELIEQSAAPVDPGAAATALREVHEALTSYRGELPELLGPREAERMVPVMVERGLVDGEDAALLARAAARSRRAVAELGLPQQPVHGDSHLGNVLATAAGPVWIDFEDVSRGPLGWDVACLVAPGRMLGRDPRPSEAALAAYGHEPEALDVLVEARAVQVTVWTVALAERLPRIRDRIPARLDWLRSLES